MPPLQIEERQPRLMGLPAVAVLHLLLLCTSLSLGGALLSQPIRNVDYTSHFYSANHFAEHFRNTLSFWGYDPFWMAGYPEGFVGLVDNKLFCVLMTLAPRGWEALAFNVAVLLVILSVPWVLYGSARRYGSSPLEASGAALAGVALTFGAPMTVLFWVGGGISFLLGSLLAVPAALGLATTLSESSLASPRGRGAVLLAMLAIFVHPFAALPIAAALVTVPLATRRRWSRVIVELVVLGGLLVVPLVPVIEGVGANLAQTKLIDGGAEFLRGGLGQAVRDWGTHLFRTDEHGFHGAGSLAAVMIAAIWGLAAGRSAAGGAEAAARRATFGAMAFAAGLAYLGAHVSARLLTFQPQRFLGVLGFFAALPAGRGLAHVVGGIRHRRPAAWALAALLVGLVGEGIWSLRHVRPLGSGVDHAEEAIPAFLAETSGDDGRVLVESTFFAARAAPEATSDILIIRFALLPLGIEREFLGNVRTGPFTAERYAGFAEGRILGRWLGKLSQTDLRDLLDLYAVSTVIACNPYTQEGLARFPEVLEPRAMLADCRGFRVRAAQTSRLLEGRGEVRAGFDRIDVHGASGERLVLKYHWTPTLRTDPPLPIEEAPQAGSPVGFIAVRPGNVRDFTIVERGWRARLFGNPPPRS